MISGLCHNMVTRFKHLKAVCPEALHGAACCLNALCEDSCNGCRASARRDFNIIECGELSRGPRGQDCYLHHLETFSKAGKITVGLLENEIARLVSLFSQQLPAIVFI